ncbi:MAG TPA: hypothetical protein VE967_06560, partial [Gemmatimonadaceae bacterium]|nr:hypothetical protein [Gemmatimonadaceae bacterium]
MQHITPERLAALADEPATLPERTHIAECAACGANLAAAQRLVRMALTETPAIERPLTSWERLSPALRAEGLVQRPITESDWGVIAERRARPSASRRMMQVAAGLFLVVGGAVMGRASAGALPGLEVAKTTDPPATTDTGFASTTDAMNVLQHSTAQAQRAMAYLTSNDSSVTMSTREAADLYRARL